MSRYAELGVNVKKPGIEKFKNAINNLFPNAFCVIQRDPAYPDMGLICHTDSAGSKPIQAYLHYKESGDPKWIEGIAQDALAMNLNDVICVGASPITFVDYVAYNTLLIDRIELLESLAKGFSNCITALSREKVPLLFAGGETADLPDIIRTFDLSVTILARGKIDELISGDKVRSGDIIVGLRSGGTVRYEEGVNSGIQSNGLTLARSCLMKPDYSKKYPEISHPGRGRYTGRFSYDDFLEDLGTTVGEALLSPTRFYAPIVNAVLHRLHPFIHGMVHNTGGGQTKCLRLSKGIKYVKENLPEPDPIFKLIQSESRVGWREMYQDFNMGIGYELILDPEVVDAVIEIVESFGIGVQILGKCEKSNGSNQLLIKSQYGDFKYS